MRTVRRLYFYTVAFISLEVVLWGLIGLARSFTAQADVIGGGAATLARALALILVGVPVFGIHWWVVQKNAREDMDEHASGVRAVFLYGILLAALIPIVQNTLSMFDRLLLEAFSLSPYQAFLGPNQTWSDNLIAVLMNAIVAVYFIIILRADWKEITPKNTFADLRRIYRYIWVIYTLVLVVAGVQQLLRFALDYPQDILGYAFRASFVHGLVLLLLGAPLWVFAWKTTQDALIEPAERELLLRLGLLYLLSLAGVVTVLTSAGIVMDFLLRLLLGESLGLDGFLSRVSSPLAIGVPLAGVWAYYGGWLSRAMTGVPDVPRRAGMRRLYTYILAAIGLGATFIGLSLLLSFTVDAAIGDLLWADTLRPRLAAALATLMAGLPLWALTWHPMQAEALAPGDSGDHARRSLVRKVFLYLASFASVIGGMITAAALLFNLLSALLGETPMNLAQQLLDLFQMLFLFVLMSVYHGLTLRRDGQMASQALAEKHTRFPVLIFDSGDGFAQTILAALQKQTPGLPAALQPVSQLVAKDAAPKAVILPLDLALAPPDSLRRWLGKYNGSRITVALAAGRWILAGQVEQHAVNQAARAVRQLAEGQEVRLQSASNWMVVVYVLAALFGLEILFALISLVASLFFG